jgi:hypothetical protein
MLEMLITIQIRTIITKDSCRSESYKKAVIVREVCITWPLMHIHYCTEKYCGIFLRVPQAKCSVDGNTT